MTMERTEKQTGAAAAREIEDREGAGQRGGALSVLRVLRRREFALFWVGQAISLIGMWMQAFAQGWVVTGLSSSAFVLGLVNFASSIPTLVLMPFGGVAADRWERRRILIWTQFALLILAAAMGALIAADRLQLWHVYVIALLLGVATAFDLPAFQSFYPQLVEKEELSQAISLNQAAFHGSRILGPALAGKLIAAWGPAAAFFANAVSYVPVIISLLLIKPRPPAIDGGQASPWDAMRQGFDYVRDRPCVQALLGLTGLTTLFIFPNFAVLMPYYARNVLRVGPDALGTLMSMSGAGALLGAVLLLTVPADRRVQRIALSAVTIMITVSVLAWSRHLRVSVAAVAIQSIAIATSMGLSSIIVQEMVPDALRGRVMSLYSLMFTGVMPFSSLLITGIADWIGMRWELQISAVLYAAGALLLLWRLRNSGSTAESRGD